MKTLFREKTFPPFNSFFPSIPHSTSIGNMTHGHGKTTSYAVDDDQCFISGVKQEGRCRGRAATS
jgi:hypothetical protein